MVYWMDTPNETLYDPRLGTITSENARKMQVIQFLDQEKLLVSVHLQYKEKESRGFAD